MPLADDVPRFFAAASRGTEPLLAAELASFAIQRIELRRGGVAFGERLEDGLRACLWSRIASRVLLPLASFAADDPEALYAAVHAIPWTDHLGPERTMAVNAAGIRPDLGPAHFLALKTKDAIVDRIRATEGARPNVDRHHAEVRVHLHLHPSQITVSLDLAGSGLHRRGLRRDGAPAPLKENLAAAILWRAGWPEAAATTPLYDPMCGSGTLLLEAAGMALERAPGLYREHNGFEGWRGHDLALWQRLVAEARERTAAAANRPIRVAGADASRDAVRAARELAQRAGLGGVLRIDLGSIAEAHPPWPDPGLVVTNPPYGVRLGDGAELGPLYEQVGDVLRRRFPGWTAWLLSGDPALTQRVGLRAASRTPLYNGPIDCRLLEIPIRATPVTNPHGPGWRKPAPAALGFANRLRDNHRERVRWAEREGLTCYRLYDSDLPEYNLAIDWYDGAVRVEEYARPFRIDAAVAERRLEDAMRVVPEVLGVEREAIVLRVRRRRDGHEQHQRVADHGVLQEVREGDLRFGVNLTDYLDTGLYLDDRLLRRRLREHAAGREVLNLFAYTCTASVAAARGGARSTTSVDLSNRYLAWGRDNFARNQLPAAAHRFVRADAMQFLAGRAHSRFDSIFCAPPTHSRSKGMAGDFDVQRDHIRLLQRVAGWLNPGGEILFSTNLRTFMFDHTGLDGIIARELTGEVTPPDFARRPRLRAWALTPIG